MSQSLPELPEPDYIDTGMERRAPGYTLGAVKAIQAAVWEAAIEEAARVAENSHPTDWPFIARFIRSLKALEGGK